MSEVPSQEDADVFVIEDITKIIKEAIEASIGGAVYSHEKVNFWGNQIADYCLSQLSNLRKNFKYVVTCSIMQKTGAGLHTASACFWDNTTDGTCTVRWENKSMYCIVSVFGLAI
ncbi:dynein light chain Tctex-type 1-like [Chrysoperla carnea]|uniref:dynein light chain Tctex-type 1-like n=1 Tax=Chrysoperla carnea TaxID=189513 RepID=UPI001D087D18|nr:dynein light chain Tctex-type 1-like [Chrysoperla carnea]